MACFDTWDIGACGCAPTGYTVTCKGCNSYIFTTGQSIQVWNHSGGTLLNTYTTNSSGQISVPAGSYYIVPASGRFGGQNVSISAPVTITFAAKSGYVCCVNLWFPVPTTIYWTDSDITHQAITYNTSFLFWNTHNYNMIASTSGCNVSSSPCCTSGTSNPNLTIGITCTGASRSWGEIVCSGGVYLYKGVTCGTQQGASSGALFGFNSTMNPPFAWTGTLTHQSGNLADPVGGTVTLTE